MLLVLRIEWGPLCPTPDSQSLDTRAQAVTQRLIKGLSGTVREA